MPPIKSTTPRVGISLAPRGNASDLGCHKSSEQPTQPHYLPETFDPLQAPDLGARHEIEEGNPYLWARFIADENLTFALQLAEEQMEFVVAHEHTIGPELISAVLTLAITFKRLNRTDEMHSVICEGRALVRERRPNYALRFEQHTLNVAFSLEEDGEMSTALIEMSRAFGIATKGYAPEARNKTLAPLQGELLSLWSMMRESDNDSLAHEIEAVSIHLVDNCYGAESFEAAVWRSKTAQRVIQFDPPQASEYLRAACRIYDRGTSEWTMSYALALSQLAYIELSENNDGAALIIARKLLRLQRLNPIIPESAVEDADGKKKLAHYFPIRRHAYVIRAKVATARDDYKHAHNLYSRALADCYQSGADTDEIVKTLNLIRENAALGDLAREEENALRSLITIADGRFGPVHRETLSATNRLLTFLDRWDRHQDGRVLCLELLEKIRTEMGETNDFFIDTLVTLASFEKEIAPRERAESTLMKALSLARKHLFGEGRATVFSILVDFAQLQARAGDVSGELTTLDKAIRYARLVFGGESPHYAQGLLERGDTYLRIGERALCEMDAQNALTTLEASPDLHEKHSEALKLLGHLRAKAENYNEALYYFESALAELEQSEYVPRHPKRVLLYLIGDCLCELSSVIPDKDQKRRALRCFLQAIKIGEQMMCNDADHMDLALYSGAYELATELGFKRLANKLSVTVTRFELESEIDPDEDGPGERILA